MQVQDVEQFRALPQSEACRRIDFDKVDIRPGFIPNTYILIVNGTKPWSTMTVTLQALIYIQQPDYWGIEVIACQNGIGLPVQAPYTATLDISQTRGKKGIEVIGATRSERRDVP